MVDASISTAWFLRGQSTPLTDYLFTELELGTISVVTPMIWPLELGNAILVAERRKLRRDLPLATRDGAIEAAAQALGIPLYSN